MTAASPATPEQTENPLPELSQEERKNYVKRQPLIERSKASAVQSRPGLAENYEQPVTERESWWRKAIRETPGPGAYEADTFLAALHTRPATYGFRSTDRRRDPQPQIGKGESLLPGAYKHQDLTNLVLEKSRSTYCFKDTGRNKRDFLNFGKKDKDINVSPNAYAMENYLTITVDKTPTKFWQFKSQTTRFPTIYFIPKEGPAPGNYEYESPVALHAVSSSFKSKTPRFPSSHTKTPGPGTYEPTFQSPMPKTIQNMGRKHGVFFSSAFKV